MKKKSVTYPNKFIGKKLQEFYLEIDNLKLIKKFLINNITELILIGVAVYTVLNWIKPGYIIAHAEEALLFYNPIRTNKIFSNFWVENSLGYFSPFSWPQQIFYLFIKYLYIFGIKNWMVQAIVFILLITCPIVTIPKLLSHVIGKDKKLIKFSASLLYLFNLFTLTQVFNRFILPLIFAWSFLPIFLYMFIKYIDENNKKYLVGFIIVNVLYSLSYSQPSTIFVAWIPSYLYGFILFIKKKNLNYLKRVLIITLLWLLINIWWLFPQLSTHNNELYSVASENNIYNSLNEVSKYFSTSDIIFLKQKYYYENEGYFKTFADSNQAVIASRLLLFFVFAGATVSVFKKKYVYFLILLFIGWFISKGTNPPLGDKFFDYIFSNFSLARVLRNSYEKFGVVLLFAYSILAAVGIYWFPKKILGKKIGSIISVLFISYIIIVLGKPIYNGDVFFGYFYIKVPEYYEQANKAILQNTKGRILHLPYHLYPNTKYTWKYNGEETSQFLFDYSNITGDTSDASTSDFLRMLPNYFNNPNFSNILSILNVGSIVIHNDLIYDKYYSYWIDSNIDMIGDWRDTEKLTQMGDLSIYKHNKSPKIEMVYLTNKLLLADNMENGFGLMLNEKFEPSTQSIYIKEQNNNKLYTVSGSTVPTLIYEKTSKRHYKAHIKDSKELYILILANSYNSLWSAKIDGKKTGNHFKVNGYANGWLIDKPGDYDVDIVFEIWPWEKY